MKVIINLINLLLNCNVSEPFFEKFASFIKIDRNFWLEYHLPQIGNVLYGQPHTLNNNNLTPIFEIFISIE